MMRKPQGEITTSSRCMRAVSLEPANAIRGRIAVSLGAVVPNPAIYRKSNAIYYDRTQAS